MEIEFLRNIGQSLFKEISLLKPQFNRTVLGRGASGDTTFPIDKLAENRIIEAFEKEGVKINIISEEIGSKIMQDNYPSLIVDPIDGSKNAVSGIPFFSTSIAIADGGTLKSLKLGYIINLVNGDEFWAKKDEGAFFNGKRIKARDNTMPVIIAFEASTPYNAIKHILPVFKMANRVRCFGSTALDLAYLSSGSINVFVVPTPSRIFDFSAGILIAKESGAIITDIEGNSIDDLKVAFNTKTTLLVSANETLHKKTLDLIK
ncbi:inositol monophosphatase family protein [Thermodesulfovibrio sp. 3907-1M]|uniref:Inositol monophosphatase family protein n=1 Tax=Thermodesulfovibrio autotrophicus TaxID=3118333 RepID=A0AAU8GY68_9BACT